MYKYGGGEDLSEFKRVNLIFCWFKKKNIVKFRGSGGSFTGLVNCTRGPPFGVWLVHGKLQNLPGYKRK